MCTYFTAYFTSLLTSQVQAFNIPSLSAVSKPLCVALIVASEFSIKEQNTLNEMNKLQSMALFSI
jgi:hypothetical protein